MTRVHIKRLEKLATHLEKGKLGHKKFDFAVFNNTPGMDDIGNKCGTLGCALGECPIIWPRLWRFNNSSVVCDGGDGFRGAKAFFGIDFNEVCHLFSPMDQLHMYGGRELGCKATRKQVARNIRAFIKKKQEQAL